MSRYMLRWLREAHMADVTEVGDNLWRRAPVSHRGKRRQDLWARPFVLRARLALSFKGLKSMSTSRRSLETRASSSSSPTRCTRKYPCSSTTIYFILLVFITFYIVWSLLQVSSIQAVRLASTQAVPGTACGAPPVM
jgi:hypothetical protein